MTETELKEIIADTFPEIEIKDIKKIGKGRNVCAVLVNKNIVFRIPIRENASFNQPDKEVKILNFLKGKLSFQVPEILYYRTNKSGQRIIGETLINGTVYTRELHDSFDVETKANILGQIGQMMRELHNLPPAPNWLDRPPLEYTDSLEAFDEYFPKSVQQQFTTEQIQKIRAVRDRYAYLSKNFPVKPVLTHCDMHFGNMMFDTSKKQIVGIIDFGEAGYAEPSRDMHYYYGEGIEQLMAGYGKIADPYFMERQLFQSVTNMLADIKEDLEAEKSPDRNVKKVLSIVQ